MIRDDQESRDPRDDTVMVPAPKQVSLLYLLSDLLSNSSCSKQGASMYRSSIEEKLENIMYSLRMTHAHIRGRITAGAMDGRVRRVLDAWEKWGVFTTMFVDRLRMIYSCGQSSTTEEREREKKQKGSRAAKETSKLGGGGGREVVEEENLDGEPLAEEEEENLDGEPLEEEEEDLDGEPKDEDIDGVPLDEEEAD